ncbi:MAG: siderophore-interacting protein [Angustibacter sp.]
MTSDQLVFGNVRVVARQSIGPNILRVTFTSEQLSDFSSVAPDQQVKLFFPRPGMPLEIPQPGSDGNLSRWHAEFMDIPEHRRPWLRTYSIRQARPAAGEVDIDFALHSAREGSLGPGTAWAGSAQPGQELGFFGPAVSHFRPWSGHPWRLLAGDSSSFGAIAAILEDAPADLPITVFGYGSGGNSPQLHQELGWASTPQRRVRWVPSGADAAAAPVESLRTHQLADNEGHIWLAGEASCVRAARRYFVEECQFPKRNIAFTGYWRQRLTSDDEPTPEDLADDE